MRSEIDNFVDFIQCLKFQSIITDSDISVAFKYLDGFEGIVKEKYFIFGYEEMAWFLNNKFSFIEMIQFLKHNKSLLSQDSGNRYYFAQAFMEKEGLSNEQITTLINAMPYEYQEYLRFRFIPS